MIVLFFEVCGFYTLSHLLVLMIKSDEDYQLPIRLGVVPPNIFLAFAAAPSPFLPGTPGGPPMTPGVPSYLPGTPGGQPMTPGTGTLDPTSPATGMYVCLEIIQVCLVHRKLCWSRVEFV